MSTPRIRSTSTVLLLAAALALSLVAPALAAPPKAGPFGPQIDAYARYEGQSSCLSVEQPGVREFRDLVMRAYPNTGRGGILRGCGTGGKSEHKEGRAWDWMVNANNPAQKAAADELLAWLLATDEHGNAHAMARRFGIMYIIWNRQVWNAYRPHEGWRPYTGAHPHTDHVHFSFTWEGAQRRTTFWTGAFVPGPFPDIAKGSNLDTPVTWLRDAGITAGRDDGRYDAPSRVTRAQMATFLWRLMDEPSAPTRTFPDVGASHHASKAISWLAQEGITLGHHDGRFGPSERVTRGQMSLFLWRLVGEPGGEPPHGFRDVTSAMAQDPAVSWLSAHDITEGVAADRFGPTSSVTRGQMALFLHRLANQQSAWRAANVIPSTVGFGR